MHLPPFWQAFCLILAPFGIVLLGIFLIDFAQYLYINGKSWLYEHSHKRYWAAKNKVAADGFDWGWDKCCEVNEINNDDVERTLQNHFLPKEEKQKRIKIMRPSRPEEQNNDD